MKHVKKFNIYNESSLSKFNGEEIEYLKDMFKVISDGYHLIDMNDSLDNNIEFNQFIVGCFRNIFIDMIIFTEHDTILSDIKNFINNAKSEDYILLTGINKELNTNDQGSRYYEIVLVFTKI